MVNKTVCPNCGQLYDPDLDKCPLCGTAPQVVDTTDPVQRKRITETERRQRRAERKEAEQEARRRRRDERFIQDADEERKLEEEEARRKEEKRRRKEEKKAARRGLQTPASQPEEAPAAETPAPAEEAAPAEEPAPAEEAVPVEAPVEEAAPVEKALPAEEPAPAEEPVPEEAPAVEPAPVPVPAPAPAPEAPVFTPGPARDGRGPMPEPLRLKDRKRVPRPFLILSTLFLAAALLVGGSYLLWKLDVVKLPIYDQLAAKRDEPATVPVPGGETEPSETEEPVVRPTRNGEPVACEAISLPEEPILLESVGSQIQIEPVLTPADATDDCRFSSSDEGVAKVSPVGIVTAMGPGEAVITVTCGRQTAQCTVICQEDGTSTASTEALAVTELILIKDDMTFFAAGENYVLSVTNVPIGTPVEWKSLDESVCTVDAGGHVVAVGPGTTRVFAFVGDLEAYCWVRCRFDG